MLITEGIDYDYDLSIFKTSNWAKDFPVRIFTYLLSTGKEDEKQMEFIACSNMGSFKTLQFATWELMPSCSNEKTYRIHLIGFNSTSSIQFQDIT